VGTNVRRWRWSWIVSFKSWKKISG